MLFRTTGNENFTMSPFLFHYCGCWMWKNIFSQMFSWEIGLYFSFLLEKPNDRCDSDQFGQWWDFQFGLKWRMTPLAFPSIRPRCSWWQPQQTVVLPKTLQLIANQKESCLSWKGKKETKCEGTEHDNKSSILSKTLFDCLTLHTRI